MKTKVANQGDKGLTRVDVIVIIAAVVFIGVFVIPAFIPMNPTDVSRAPRILCISNLKQILLASRLWEDDNNHRYSKPNSTNGAFGWPETNLAVYFQTMSNELMTPKVLICPADREHIPATNWTTDFNNSRISYFLNPDASETYPQEIMLGDDNLATNDEPVKSGLLLLSTNTAVSWTTERHGRVGNISFADGSVVEESSSGLQNASELSVQGTPFTTNRIVIP